MPLYLGRFSYTSESVRAMVRTRTIALGLPGRPLNRSAAS